MAVIKNQNARDGFDTGKRTYDAGKAQEESSLITAISLRMKDEAVAIIAIDIQEEVEHAGEVESDLRERAKKL
ncbi:hypothetical protein QWY16_14665 [Planococcus shenhongbingii]|uniref:hypothetical protein n=1 Tax=Planococcus shenhongbingii TaxID=3058398 RepID=UPI0026235BFE|nr:hypothetical protein [Planococcus sp. N016]WKA57729.1 hypothetical protein QWY16_14665 [Planococcus sp. N016]